MENLYYSSDLEITLEEKFKLKPKKIKHFFKPIYGTKMIKKKIGKLSIKDQLEAQKCKWKLAPERKKDNLMFLAWIANRLIKKCDPYWDKTEKETVGMFNYDTIKELNNVLLTYIPDDLKKNSVLMDKETK